MLRLGIIASVVLALVSSDIVFAQDESKYNIAQLVAMDGKVVSANEKYVWIVLESFRSDVRAEFYVCTYNVEEPGGRSSCTQVK